MRIFSLDSTKVGRLTDHEFHRRKKKEKEKAKENNGNKCPIGVNVVVDIAGSACAQSNQTALLCLR